MCVGWPGDGLALNRLAMARNGGDRDVAALESRRWPRRIANTLSTTTGGAGTGGSRVGKHPPRKKIRVGLDLSMKV